MARREIDTIWDRETRNNINENFIELYNEYIGAGLDAKEAKQKAEQALNIANQSKQQSQIAEDKADATQQQLDNIIIESGTSDAEVIQARGDFDLLYQRLDFTDKHVTDLSLDVESRGVNALLNGVVGDGVTDDTQAIQDLINNNSYIVFPIPEESYAISDEIIVPSNRTLEFIGGNHWNPNNQREVRFRWIGDTEPTKAMFRLSKAPTEQEPTSDTSNVKFKGGCVLDGNEKAGYGFYAAFITNESAFEKITVINTLTDGFKVDKAWYASFRDITAKGNFGNGITIGRNGWGGVNGCLIENLRGHSNGKDGSFSEENYNNGYGVGLWLGSGTTAFNIVSEQNYGAGLIYGMGRGSVIKIDTVYLEKNGIQAKEDGKTHRNWGIIVDGKPGMTALSLENVYLARSIGHPEVQSIWLTGEKPSNPLEIRNISLGQHLKADWEEYKLTGYVGSGMSQYIEGHFPKVCEGVINSNWNTLYVRDDGDDNNTGRTQANAFRTLEKALEVAKRIYTVTTIDCVDMTINMANLDFTGLDRTISINGGSTAMIDGSINNNNGLIVTNVSNEITFSGFSKISRINLTNCRYIKFSNIDFGHRDSQFSGSAEIKNSNVIMESCSFNGLQATNQTRNGVRLYNSRLTLKDTTITGYTQGRHISIYDGSQILADVYVSAFQSIYWGDGSGMVQGGDRIRVAAGVITIS